MGVLTKIDLMDKGTDAVDVSSLLSFVVTSYSEVVLCNGFKRDTDIIYIYIYILYIYSFPVHLTQ